MSQASVKTRVPDSLHRLAVRVRWKRWLGKVQRFVWLLVGVFLFVFLLDWLIGMRTLGLRFASGVTLAAAIALFAVDWIAAWLVRLDLTGLAQLLEKRYPELAERLVTLVQLPSDGAEVGLAPLLRAETEQCLADVDPDAACPLVKERKTGLATVGLLTILFVGLSFVPGFGQFTQRFFGAWLTPLVPYTIEVKPGNVYALRGGSCAIEATFHLHDDRVEPPTECTLVCEDEAGATTIVPMTSSSAGTYRALLENLRQPLRCQAKVGAVVSKAFEVCLIDAPVFTAKPAIVVTPPSYMPTGSRMLPFNDPAGILRFSKMQFQLPLERLPVHATLQIKTMPNPNGGKEIAATLPVNWKQGSNLGTAGDLAARPGRFHAELVLTLEHGLATTLPLGTWTVHDDEAPQFTQSLRLKGGGHALLSNRDYVISLDDALKLQTVIEDNEGLDSISFEYRINDGAPRVEKWLDAGGQKKLVVDHWLPLPHTLKADDRVQFRVHASDSRRLKKGEVLQSKAGVLPTEDLMPQVTIAPSDGVSGSWITLRVDRSAESLVKQHSQAQRDELRDVIAKLIQKVKSEIEQVQQLQRTIHQQSALTLAQIKQAETLRGLNREIILDLQAAEMRFGADPELAQLAEHFLEIAETDMLTSALALKNFSDKERSLGEEEKELQVSQDALLQARKKLERMLAWNTLLAQDRLDQFKIEVLAKRQKELAQRLESLLAGEALNDAEKAKQIEAMQQEQAKLAERTEQLQEQSRLVQESMESLQQIRAQRLAEDAKQLAAEQRAMSEMAPEKLPPEIKDRLGKVAQAQAALAQRVQPFAQKSDGPDLKSAEAAANALKKPQIGAALRQQLEHEKRLQEWIAKLLPGASVNSLREQALQLAKQQQAIRNDFERLANEVEQLEYSVIQQRLRELTQREKDLRSAIANLPTENMDEPVRRMQKVAELSALRAGDQLARDNAEGAPAARKHMKQAQQELEALANMMPKSLPIDRKDIKDDALRAKIDSIEQFGKEQKKLREETERLQAAAATASAGQGKNPLAQKTDKLASELMELSQIATSPEAKALAKESAQTLEAAKKAMDASQAMNAKGDAEQAKKMADDADRKLEFVVKQLDKLVKDQTPKNMPKDNADKTAAALKKGGAQMREAQAKLPTMPKKAKGAMQSAAEQLAEAARQAAKLSASKVPNASRNPAAQPSLGKAGGSPSSAPKELKLGMLEGKAWGELPGDLKTQMLQDVQTRFGSEYAEMIRQYFESLADGSRTERKE